MNQYWEDKFRLWAKPPSKSEQDRCDNAVSAIQNAIKSSEKLKQRDIKIFSQGSYRNNTNVRQDSDVDVGVLCFDTFFYDLPEGKTQTDFSITPASYEYTVFKNEIGDALTKHFGSSAVKRGNKAFDIKATSYHVEADVAPFFEHRRYDNYEKHSSGVELKPDNGQPSRVINWPEQHYENGVAKNKNTNTRYKSVVRILKSLRNEMNDDGIAEAAPVVGFLNECLVWNAPNGKFGHPRYWDDVREVVAYLYDNTKTDSACNEWGEVSELKYLFRSNQKWTRSQANEFLLAAWNYVGF